MLISIIIPVYNAEKYIRKSLDSVLGQTYQKLEVILVNDGSTDQSGAICNEYAQKDSRVVVLHKENGGVSSARNAGLKRAKGNYIGFIDPDDWIDPYMFEELYQLIIDHNADISACGYVIEDINGNILKQTAHSEVREFNRAATFNNILDPTGFQGYVCNKLFSAELIKKEDIVFNEDIHFGEDLLFCCDNFLKNQKFVYDPSPRYHYIYHDNNTTKATFSPKKLTLLKSLEKIIPFISNLEGVEINQFKNYYIYTNINLLMHSMKEKKRTRVLRKQLKRNLYKCKRSDLIDSSVKITYVLAKINIRLCYYTWAIYHRLKSAKSHSGTKVVVKRMKYV